MPLPGIVSSNSSTYGFPDHNYHVGPFEGSSSTLYTFLVGTSSVRAFKSINGGESWGSFGSISIGSGVASVWCTQDGDTIHIVAQQFLASGMANDRNIHYASVDLTTDTVGSPVTVETINDSGIHSACSIARRSNGDLIIAAQKLADKVMGVDYSRIGYYKSTDGGASWSAATLASGTASDEMSHTSAVAVLGALDRVHFFYKSDQTAGGGTGNHGLHRSLSSSDILDNQLLWDASIDNNTAYVYGKAVYDGSEILLPFLDTDNGKIVTLSSQADPSALIVGGIADNRAQLFTSGTTIALVLDGTDRHFIYVDSSTDDLFHDVDTGSGWGVDTELLDGVTITDLSANLTTDAIGYVYDDGGAVKYNEYALSAGATTADIVETSPVPQESLSAEVGATELTIADSIPIATESNNISNEVSANIQDTTPAPTESSSVNIEVSTDLTDAAPIPSDSLNASIGPVTSDISDTSPVPTESLSAEHGPITSDIADVTPVPDESNDISVTNNISAEIQDTAPVPTEASLLNVALLLDASDTIPVPSEALDASVAATTAEISDVSPTPGESIAIDVDPTTLDIAESAPTPQESLNISSIVTAGIDDSSPIPDESTSATVEVDLAHADTIPITTESSSISAQVDSSIEDSISVPNEANDLSVVVETNISDTSPVPNESNTLEVGATTASIDDQTLLPQESVSSTVAISASISETIPIVTEAAKIVSPQFARPTTTQQAGTWTSPQFSTDIYRAIDEEIPDDTDYIDSGDLGSQAGTAYIAGLSGILDPEVSVDHIIRIRARKSSSGGEAVDIWFSLRELSTGTVIAESAEQTDISDVWTNFEFTLTAAEADSITNYNDLGIGIRARGDLAPLGQRTAQVSWAEMQLPGIVEETTIGNITDTSPAVTESTSLEVGPTTIDISDNIPIAVESNSLSAVVDTDMSDQSPIPTESNNAEIGATTVSASDETSVPQDSVDITNTITGSVSDTLSTPTEDASITSGDVTTLDIAESLQIPIEAADLTTPITLDISDSIAIPNETTTGTINVSLDSSDSIPVPSEDNSISQSVSGTVNDNAPIIQESVDTNIGSDISLDIGDSAPAPTEDVDTTAQIGLDVSDTVVVPQESASATAGDGAVLNVDDTVPTPSESIDGTIPINFDISDAVPALQESADLNLAVSSSQSDTLSSPSESGSLSVGSDVTADISDVVPTPGEEASVSTEVEAQILDAISKVTESSSFTVEAQATVDEQLPGVQELISIVSINKLDIGEELPSPIETSNASIARDDTIKIVTESVSISIASLIAISDAISLPTSFTKITVGVDEIDFFGNIDHIKRYPVSVVPAQKKRDVLPTILID